MPEILSAEHVPSWCALMSSVGLNNEFWMVTLLKKKTDKNADLQCVFLDILFQMLLLAVGRPLLKNHINGIMQDCSDSTANALELLQSCTKPSILYWLPFPAGDQVAMFADLRYQKPITCVIFHPHDHMMAMCALGDNEPILVYRFNHKGSNRHDILKLQFAPEWLCHNVFSASKSAINHIIITCT